MKKQIKQFRKVVDYDYDNDNNISKFWFSFFLFDMIYFVLTGIKYFYNLGEIWKFGLGFMVAGFICSFIRFAEDFFKARKVYYEEIK